jgi:septum formation topological specificity factor MinE
VVDRHVMIDPDSVQISVDRDAKCSILVNIPDSTRMVARR